MYYTVYLFLCVLRTHPQFHGQFTQNGDFLSGSFHRKISRFQKRRFQTVEVCERLPLCELCRKAECFAFRELGYPSDISVKIDKISKCIWVTDKFGYMAKGHPKVGWAAIGFAVATPWTNLPQFQGGPLSVLQWWQPQDPLNSTLVIPNFVRYSIWFFP